MNQEDKPIVIGAIIANVLIFGAAFWLFADSTSLFVGKNHGQHDVDGDGVRDGADNCLIIGNPDQADMNANGVGDRCDPDMDSDGVSNGIDNCPYASNPYQHDVDRDGFGNVCDDCPMAWERDQVDSNRDGIGDACDPIPNG